MADAPQNQGFILPAPNPAAPAQPAPPSGQVSEAPQAPGSNIIISPAGPGTEGPQIQEYVIGGGILLVLIVAFFFAKKAYSRHLATRHVPPGPANAAGWWLFIFLSSLATTSVMAVVNSAKFLSLFFVAPMGIVSLAALVLMFLQSRQS